EAWTSSQEVPAGRDCEADSDIRYTLLCNEAEVVRRDAGVRIGNFATDIKVQELASGALRLFTAVRGDPSLTYLDYDEASGELECGTSDSSFPRCDDEHRLVDLQGDPEVGRIPDEPFGLYVDSGNGFVFVTHLTQGAVSLANAPTDGAPPTLTDA